MSKQESIIEKWHRFLNPENLKDNLIFSSLYISSYESFKDYIVDTLKFFYNKGFSDGEFTFSRDYTLKVKSLDKSIFRASLLWLKNMNAINENDLITLEELRIYRNKLSHELWELLFEDLSQELPEKFMQLISIRIKIEKWWILNIEIPTNPDYDLQTEITEDEITTSSQMFFKLIMDMLSGDDKTASFYQNDFKKRCKE